MKVKKRAVPGRLETADSVLSVLENIESTDRKILESNTLSYVRGWTDCKMFLNGSTENKAAGDAPAAI